ncbi:MAG: 3-oxoacyl-[acyl-carrier-protein] reductase [Planctomycetaceae bacterium]|nr:MAG: 3-oxoacyl-[acyl-carrier-protein] reductase [Planctomycetaceae bacterium]
MADENKVAIVTGGARGIGREIVRELLSMGMTVVAVDMKADLLAELPAALGNPGDKLQTAAMDVTNSEGFSKLIEDVAEKHGHLDVLVNNAGITRDNIVLMLTDQDWDLVLKVNLTSAFIGTRAAGKIMMRQRSGSIIYMSSYSGLEGNRGQANYAASKAGMLGLMKSAAKELAKRSVRCNAVCPGFIETEMTAVLPQQAKDMALEQIPMQRFGKPLDIAKAVGFLASDASAYVTGQTLSVDGGMHT